MNQDKLIKYIQHFFRLLSWSMIPCFIAWFYMTISFTFFPEHFIPRLLKTKDLPVDPITVPFSLIILSIIFLLATAVGYFLYRSIWKLIKHIREENITRQTIQKINFLSYLFLVGMIFDIIVFIIFKVDFSALKVYMNALSLIGPVINWYHFVYVEFTGITGFVMFVLCKFFVRFIEYYLNIRTNMHELEKENKLTI